MKSFGQNLYFFQTAVIYFLNELWTVCEGIITKSELKVQNTIQQRSLLNKNNRN